MRHTTDQSDFLDVTRLQAGMVEGLLAGIDNVLDERVDGGLELETKEPEVDVVEESSILAFSVAPRTRWTAISRSVLGYANGTSHPKSPQAL